jgi:hypothetical protein
MDKKKLGFAIDFRKLQQRLVTSLVGLYRQPTRFVEGDELIVFQEYPTTDADVGSYLGLYGVMVA